MAEQPKPPSRETLEKLDEELGQPGVLEKVVGTTNRLVRTLETFGLPGGDDVVREYVQRAIDDTRLGIRTWKPEWRLSTHLCWAVRNYVRNDLKRVKKRRHIDHSALVGTDEELDERDEEHAAVWRQFTLAVFEELYKLARENKDEGVEALLVALESNVNYEGRTDLAEACDMTVQEVTAAKKRLGRLIEQLPAELRELP